MTTITEIELIPIRAKGGLTFFANCVLDGKYFVGNVAVFTRRDGSGFRCVYPTKRLSNGKQIPIFYPISSEVGSVIEEVVNRKARKLLVPETDENVINDE